ncbi:guanine nucleotide binding protein, alpha subunit [Chytriomyces cf. hyalinus JEL632]|nr:guanine nucleotide binding protein, alpha subunit [Chytriomyces cf. hyalinus JEL632]
MGSCDSKEVAPGSTPADISKEATAKSKEIDRQLADEKVGSKDIKILLLGTAETGKSTVLKQLRIIHGGGFTDDDITTFRYAAKRNIFDTVKTLVEAMELLKIPYGFNPNTAKCAQKSSKPSLHHAPSLVDSKENVGFGKNAPIAIEAAEVWASTKFMDDATRGETQAAVDLILSTHPEYTKSLPLPLVNAIKLLWNNVGVKYCFSRSNEFQIIDLSYFMQDIDRFIASDYIPTNQDILASRVMTSGVCETKVIIKGTIFRVFDVGGQRNERRKWIHVFDNVNAIFFLFDLSAFNQVTVEDQNINRVVESLTVFTFICNHNAFKKSAIMIFMNKIDLLREKLEHSMVQDYFPEFLGTNDYKEVSKFFAEKIASFNKNQEKQLYFHYTQANDTTKMKAVLATVIESILVNNLQSAGLM